MLMIEAAGPRGGLEAGTCLEAAGPRGGLVSRLVLILTSSDSPGRYRPINSSIESFFSPELQIYKELSSSFSFFKPLLDKLELFV